MRKLMLTAAVAIMAVGMAGAQSFEGENGTYQLVGCYVTREGVRCDFNYLAKQDSQVYFQTRLFQVITPSGGNLEADRVAAGDGSWNGSYTTSLNVYRGIPLKVSALFELPDTTKSLRILTVQGSRTDNVVVRSSATPAPAPRPTTTTTAAPANTGNYNAVLTGCKPGANGTLTCTATLTPRR